MIQFQEISISTDAFILDHVIDYIVTKYQRRIKEEFVEISIRGVSKLTSLNGPNFTLFTFLRLNFFSNEL